MTVSLILEITTETRPFFYNPAVDGCRAFPRTENGIKRAVKNLIKWVQDNEGIGITGARIVAYQGKYEYYKRDMVPIFTQDLCLVSK